MCICGHGGILKSDGWRAWGAQLRPCGFYVRGRVFKRTVYPAYGEHGNECKCPLLLRNRDRDRDSGGVRFHDRDSGTAS